MSMASSIHYSKLKISQCPSHHSFIVRSSNVEGPLRKPSAPSLSPSLSPHTKPNITPTQPQTQTQTQTLSTKANVGVGVGVTLEYQRKIAIELQDYFKQNKIDEADQGPFFGFIAKNEIANGRWAMFGFAVGLLTEYATGADFVQQLKILLSNFGIVDLD